ncbi:hypothetical protein CDL12_27163 [Handroanthus impetiginosus]|uniref:Pentatricopeptide n=1 Tax=Handroanthus impetiginosus TaxID=429701 RepID=A0A2G9G4U5_9LAMI|nr:hypothetical protein CDL12_27163 [Handroanthus impetiginosus]
MENHSCVPNSVTYNVIIQGLLKRKELCKAMPFLGEMHKRGFSVDAATTPMLVDQLQRGGKDDILLKMSMKFVPNC